MTIEENSRQATSVTWAELCQKYPALCEDLGGGIVTEDGSVVPAEVLQFLDLIHESNQEMKAPQYNIIAAMLNDNGSSQYADRFAQIGKEKADDNDYLMQAQSLQIQGSALYTLGRPTDADFVLNQAGKLLSKARQQNRL